MTSPRHCIDLSHPLCTETQIYPSDPPFLMTPHATHEKDAYAVHRLALGTHTGTHIDAPYHFLADGRTIDALPLSTFFGTPYTIDLSAAKLAPRQPISCAQMEPHLAALAATPETRRERIVLINTGWSAAHYQTPVYNEHPYFLPEVASRLLELGVEIVCVDTLSPDETPAAGTEGAHGFGFHERFLGGRGLIAENLTNIEALLEHEALGYHNWIIHLVPLRLVGADGSPIRAFVYRP